MSSENTVDYWPLDEDEQRRLLQTSRPSTTPTVSKNVQQRTFSMSTHGIRRRKHRYYFKCKIGPCNKSYSNIRDWNAHHRQKHGTLIRCTSCPNEEECGNPESSGPRMEANTEDIPPLVSGGDTISPEEEAILLQETPQPEDPAAGSRSPRSKTATVSGEMAELCLTSPSHPGPEEDETPQ